MFLRGGKMTKDEIIKEDFRLICKQIKERFGNVNETINAMLLLSIILYDNDEFGKEIVEDSISKYKKRKGLL